MSSKTDPHCTTSKHWTAHDDKHVRYTQLTQTYNVWLLRKRYLYSDAIPFSLPTFQFLIFQTQANRRTSTRATVTEINRNLAATLKLTGPSLISNPSNLTSLSKTVVSLLNKQHSCQLDMGPFDSTSSPDDLDPGVIESSEYDWLVIDTALDVIVSLSHVLGPSFAEFYKLVDKSILRFASSSESYERSTAVGVLAECIRGMEASVTPYTSSLFKILMHRLQDEDAGVKSNAVFAIGLLVANSEDEREIGKNFNTVLAKLEPLLGEDEARTKDNAAGCVGRMISNYQDKVPLGAVLPALVSVLPLKEDFEENTAVWECLVRLCKSNITLLIPILLPSSRSCRKLYRVLT